MTKSELSLSIKRQLKPQLFLILANLQSAKRWSKGVLGQHLQRLCPPSSVVTAIFPFYCLLTCLGSTRTPPTPTNIWVNSLPYLIILRTICMIVTHS